MISQTEMKNVKIEKCRKVDPCDNVENNLAKFWFLYWSFIIQIYRICFFTLVPFLWILWDYPYIDHVICEDNFFLLFQIWCLLFTFLLFFQAKTSSTILNNNSESGIFVLFLILKEKFLPFHHWVWC